MKAPSYEAPPLDPAFMALQGQAKEQDTEAIQVGLRRDSASLLARYGAQLTMAGSGGGASPAEAAAPAVTRSQLFTQFMQRSGRSPFGPAG